MRIHPQLLEAIQDVPGLLDPPLSEHRIAAGARFVGRVFFCDVFVDEKLRKRELAGQMTQAEFAYLAASLRDVIDVEQPSSNVVNGRFMTMPFVLEDTCTVYRFAVEIEEQPIDEKMESMLFAAGCGDALLHSEGPNVSLDFDRSASNATVAVRTAVLAIRDAGYTPRCVLWSSAAADAARLVDGEEPPRLHEFEVSLEGKFDPHGDPTNAMPRRIHAITGEPMERMRIEGSTFSVRFRRLGTDRYDLASSAVADLVGTGYDVARVEWYDA